MNYNPSKSVDDNIREYDKSRAKKGSAKQGKSNKVSAPFNGRKKVPPTEKKARKKLTDIAVRDYPAAAKLLDGLDVRLRQVNYYHYQLRGSDETSPIKWCLNCFPSTGTICPDRTLPVAPKLTVKKNWNLFDLANAMLKHLGLSTKEVDQAQLPPVNFPEELIRALASRAVMQNISFTEDDFYRDFKDIIDNW